MTFNLLTRTFVGMAMLFLILTCVLCAAAQAQDRPRYVSIIAENDIFAPKAQDRHYTSGLRLAYGLQDGSQQPWSSWLGRLAPLQAVADNQNYELAIGQNIYTPEFFRTSGLVVNDRPYAGWLYGELSVNSHAPGMEEGLVVNLGTIGPAALGEEVQKLLHTIINDPEPRGWDHQLENEPAVLLRYRRSWFHPLFLYDHIQGDLITRVGLSLGNIFTDTGFGTVFRIGSYLPEQDLPLRIQPGPSGNRGYFTVRKQQFDWMVFAEVQGRGVARNIFLDGNTFTDSHSVDRNKFVWDTATGFILGFGQSRPSIFFSFSLVWRGEEFDQQRGNDSFGSALIGIQY